MQYSVIFTYLCFILHYINNPMCNFMIDAFLYKASIKLTCLFVLLL